MSLSERRRDVRIDDYLNDKLQTSADLASIDSLLEDVKQQQSLLKQQLSEAKRTHDEASSAVEEQNRTLWGKIQSFRERQADIDQRLLILTHSDTSDEAVQKFGPSIEKIQRLEIAQGYVKILSQVEALTLQARKNFNKDPKDALKPYLKLSDLTQQLRERQPAAEYAAPHLIDHVDHTCQSLWQQMKDAFAEGFDETLKKMKWPGKDVSLEGDLHDEWADGVRKLLDLQDPELKSRDQDDESATADPLVLLPLAVMVKPLELRFRYHFQGDRPTNKLDKPEYFLSHVIGLLNTYDEFFARFLQPILQEHYQNSTLGLSLIYIDSTSAYITALLPMVRQKLISLVPQLAKKPQLLSHLIHELMMFDNSLRDEWSYDGGNRVLGWKGLTWELLSKQGWFSQWLTAEKGFALARYQQIVDRPENFELDYDSVDSAATKPTKAAVQVHDLLETITDRYKPLQSFSQKVQFLINIQISIFDSFHSRLHDSFSAYQSLTSTLGRNIQGASRETQAELQGVNGLERLCRIYGSAEFLEKKMQDWSDDVFFIDLWDELQDRARQHTSKTGHNGNQTPTETFAGNMSVEHVAGRTSSAVGSEEDLGGALFDETAGAYRRLRLRTEEVMQDRLISAVRDALRPYGRINPWSALSAGKGMDESEGQTRTISGPSAPTAELDAVVQLLNEHLAFLSGALSQAPRRQITRQVALAMQTFLWDSVAQKHVFSEAGAAQLRLDVQVLWETIDRWVGRGQGALGMRMIREALVLLCLPAASSTSTSTSSSSSSIGNDDVDVTLWTVEQRIFKDNESAREVLEQLGLVTLRESEARSVLERRLELGQ